MQVQANEEIVKMHQYANAEDIHSQDGEQVRRMLELPMLAVFVSTFCRCTDAKSRH